GSENIIRGQYLSVQINKKSAKGKNPERISGVVTGKVIKVTKEGGKLKFAIIQIMRDRTSLRLAHLPEKLSIAAGTRMAPKGFLRL
ncbi:MAG: hypothetical protein OEV93_04815, partial [Candidatus Moranbacteria bacterium]|nr:hypothetical protein [Candidatus Moranbacteria bacterium]